MGRPFLGIVEEIFIRCNNLRDAVGMKVFYRIKIICFSMFS